MYKQLVLMCNDDNDNKNDNIMITMITKAITKIIT